MVCAMTAMAQIRMLVIVKGIRHANGLPGRTYAAFFSCIKWVYKALRPCHRFLDRHFLSDTSVVLGGTRRQAARRVLPDMASAWHPVGFLKLVELVQLVKLWFSWFRYWNRSFLDFEISARFTPCEESVKYPLNSDRFDHFDPRYTQGQGQRAQRRNRLPSTQGRCWHGRRTVNNDCWPAHCGHQGDALGDDPFHSDDSYDLSKNEKVFYVWFIQPDSDKVLTYEFWEPQFWSISFTCTWCQEWSMQKTSYTFIHRQVGKRQKMNKHGYVPKMVKY